MLFYFLGPAELLLAYWDVIRISAEWRQRFILLFIFDEGVVHRTVPVSNEMLNQLYAVQTETMCLM